MKHNSTIVWWAARAVMIKWLNANRVQCLCVSDCARPGDCCSNCLSLSAPQHRHWEKQVTVIYVWSLSPRTLDNIWQHASWRHITHTHTHTHSELYLVGDFARTAKSGVAAPSSGKNTKINMIRKGFTNVVNLLNSSASVYHYIHDNHIGDCQWALIWFLSSCSEHLR